MSPIFKINFRQFFKKYRDYRKCFTKIKCYRIRFSLFLIAHTCTVTQQHFEVARRGWFLQIFDVVRHVMMHLQVFFIYIYMKPADIIRPPVYGSNGRSYKMLVMFSFFLFLGRPFTVVTGGLIKCSWCFFLFSLFIFATHSPSSLDRSPWNFAT